MLQQNDQTEAFIKIAFKKALEEAAEQEFEFMKKRLDERKDALISSIALHVMKSIDFRRMENRLIIEITTEDIK